MPQNTPSSGNPGLGGLNLSALAAQGQAETGRRIQGQSGLISAYLDQVLGMNDAKNAAGSEREQRMLELQRKQAMMQEALQRSRMGQDATLQRARIGASASEGAANRAHAAGMADDRRIFELGQAAVQRPGESEQARAALENRMLELQILAAEQELGPQQAEGWGRGEVAADRGAELSRGRQNDLRSGTYGSTTKRVQDSENGRSRLNFGGLGVVDLPNIGPDVFGSRHRDEQVPTTYDDLLGTADSYMNEFGEDPNVMVRKIKELAKGRPQLASLLLKDIGYYGFDAAVPE